MKKNAWLLTCLISVCASVHAEDVDGLARKLSDPDISIRIEVATSLGKMGEAASPAVPALILALKQAYKDMSSFENSELRKAAAIALGEIGPKAKDAVPLLEYAIKDGSLTAAAALSKVAPDRVAEINEIVAVHWCKQYGDSQAQYSAQKKEFAQKLKGATGLGNLLPDRFANADGDSAAPKPLCNYCFRVLNAQGDKVPGGRKAYIVDGRMTDGAALVAYPVEYGVNGKKTFLVGLIDGHKRLYSKDLGADSTRLGKEMTEFNPDDTWKKEDASWGLAPGSAPELKP
jgi:hypothetical protein